MSRISTKSPSKATQATASQGTTTSTPSSTGTEKGIPTPHISHDAIAKRAYEKYVARGCEPGFEQQDWLDAEQELAGDGGSGKKRRR